MYPRLLCLSVDGKLAAVLRALAEAAAHWLALAPLDLEVYDDGDDDDALVDDNQVLIDIDGSLVPRLGMYLDSGTSSTDDSDLGDNKNDLDTDVDVDGQTSDGLETGTLDSEADGDEELVRDVLRVIERDLEMAANISLAEEIVGQNKSTGVGRDNPNNIEDGFEPETRISGSLEEDLNSEPPTMDAMVADHALSRRRDPVRTMVSQSVLDY
jgi:hypothetical protein